MTHVIFDVPYQGKKEFALDGLFIEIGHLPQNELALQLGVAVDAKGEIIVDKYSQTSVPGVYAAGDITDLAFKQAITGAAQGTIATYVAYDYLQSIKTQAHKEEKGNNKKT
ncbi:MAG: NAD(P)/FAD-dependent oxidoreductase, partial [Candidatus Woesearchaeota archaeon]